MRSLTVGCLHYELRDDVARNRERLLSGIEDALGTADLVVGPEAPRIPVDPPGTKSDRFKRNVEPVDGGTVSRAQELVDHHGGVVVFGLAERADGERYNSAVVLEANRDPRVYRQPNLSQFAEYPESTGDNVTDYGSPDVDHCETGLGVVQPLICADLGALVRGHLDMDTGTVEILAVPANYRETEPEYREEDYRPLLDRWCEYSTQLSVPIAVGNGYRAHDQDWPSAIVQDGAVVAATRTPGETVSGTVEL